MLVHFGYERPCWNHWNLPRWYDRSVFNRWLVLNKPIIHLIEDDAPATLSKVVRVVEVPPDSSSSSDDEDNDAPKAKRAKLNE